MTGKRFALGDAAIDLAAGRVRAPDGTETELRVQSAEVLRALAARRGETVTKDELHAAVWGDIAVTDDSLVQCIGDIRRALGAARDAVQTVRGRGYRLAAEGEAVPRARWRPRFLAMPAPLAVLAIAGAFALVAARRPAGRGRAAGGASAAGRRGAALREPVRAGALGPAGARRDRGGDRRPRHEFLDLRAGRRHHPPARRGDAAGGRRGARGRPRRHRHRPGRGRPRAGHRRPRRRRQRPAALGPAVGRAARRPARDPGRRRRRRWSASSPAATPARSPAPTAPAPQRRNAGSLAAYELYPARCQRTSKDYSLLLSLAEGLPETGGRDRPAVRKGLGGSGQHPGPAAGQRNHRGRVRQVRGKAPRLPRPSRSKPTPTIPAC